jgi:hypothetical protein
MHSQNKNSAVAVFETLNREKANLERATRLADQTRAAAETRLSDIRLQKKQLEEEFRDLSTQVGTLHRTSAMHQQERLRLQTVLRDERGLLEETVGAFNDVLRLDRERKRAFCKKMAACNDDLGEILMQQEDLRLVRLISIETLPRLQAAILQYQQTTSMMTDDNDNDDKENPSLMCEEDEEKLKEATDAVYHWHDRKKQLRATVETLRERALQTHGDHQEVRDNRGEFTFVFVALHWWLTFSVLLFFGCNKSSRSQSRPCESWRACGDARTTAPTRTATNPLTCNSFTVKTRSRLSHAVSACLRRPFACLERRICTNTRSYT